MNSRHKVIFSRFTASCICFYFAGASLLWQKQSFTSTNDVLTDFVIFFFLLCIYDTTPSCSNIKHYHSCFLPLHLCCRWGRHSFSFFPNFSHAHAFNFYHGVELYSKAQISAVQQLFGENLCAGFFFFFCFSQTFKQMHSSQTDDCVSFYLSITTLTQTPVSLSLCFYYAAITPHTYLSATWR